MHFDPLCNCNETIYPQALHTVRSDFSKKKKFKKKGMSAAKMSLCILTGTQQYLSGSQAICPEDKTHKHSLDYNPT